MLARGDQVLHGVDQTIGYYARVYFEPPLADSLLDLGYLVRIH
jgi:hypothetical protein